MILRKKMIDELFYRFFGAIDDLCGWFYDKFICDLPKKDKKKK